MLSHRKRKIGLTIIGVLLFMMGIFLIDHYKKNYREQKLRNTKQTWGIFVEEVIGVGRRGFYYRYYNEKGVKYRFIDKTYYRHLKRGDTVLIEYSLDDYEVGRVIQPYYKRK